MLCACWQRIGWRNHVTCVPRSTLSCLFSLSTICGAFQKRIDSFVSNTSAQERDQLDVLVARFFIATNTPFNRVEHPTFLALVSALRSSYRSPNRHVLAEDRVNKVHEECTEQAQKDLNELVTLSLDGWSNIHNEPIVCIGASTTSGDFYLVDSKDTSGNQHKAEYLQELVEDCLESTCATFNVDVSGFVTGNAANVAKLRRQLEDGTFDDDVMLYGCGAKQTRD